MKKILTIDDNKDNLTTIKAVINNYMSDCKVLTALSGEEGIKIAQKEQPDTILLDIIMPKMDGFEVLNRLKTDSSTKHIPVIMITAIKTDSANRIKGLNMGAEAFVAKPIDINELSAQINVMLRIKEAEDKLRSKKDILEETVLERTKEIRLINEQLNKFAQIVSSSSDMLAFIDSRFIYVTANKSYTDAFKLTSEQLIGKTVSEVFGKEFFNTVIKPNADRCLGGEIVNYEDWFNFPMHGKRYMEIKYSPYYSEDNEITGFMVNGRDITERKLAEDEIRNSEHLRNILLDNIPIISLIIKKHTREIVACNKLAVDSGAVIGKTCYETLTKCSYSCPFCLAPELWKTNEYQYIETEYIGRHWEGRWIPFTDELYIHFIVDITDRKLAEKRLIEQSVFVKQNPAPVFSINYSGEIIAINNATQKISKDLRPGKLIYEIFSDLDSLSVNNLKDNLPIQFTEKINSKYYLFAIKKNLENESIYFFGMDITDRKQTEKDLQYNIENQRNLLEVSKSLTSTLDMKTVLQNITDSSMQLARMDTAAIYIIQKGELYLGAASPPLPQDFPEEFKQALLVNHPNIQKAVSIGKPHIVHDLDTANLTPEEKAIKESRNMRTIVYIPLIVKRQALGVLILATINDTRLISKSEIDLYKALSPQAALALDNSRLYEKTQKSVTELKQRILERKQAEVALKESEEILELFFSQSLGGFFFMMLDEPVEWNDKTDKDSVMDYVFTHQRVTKANDAILKQYGATKEQFIGLTPTDFFVHNLDYGKKVWREFFDSGKLKVETDERKMDGSSMIIEGDYTCMYDSKNRIIGHFGIQRDITDQKLASDALQNSERKYKDLFEKSDDAVLIISDEHFVDCNMATVRMLRYKNKKDILNTHPSELSPEKQPDGRMSFEKAEEMMNLAIRKGSHRFEWDHKKSDGDVFPVEVLLTSIIGSNGKNIIHTVWRDITDRKRSNQVQKTLYDISNAVNTSDNLEKLIELIQKEIGLIIDTTNFYIALYDSESDTISLPFMLDEKDKFEAFPAGKTLTYYVIKTRKPLLATKMKVKELEKSGEVERFGSDSEIWLGVPLKIEGKVTGVLAVQSYTDEDAYNESDMEMLEFVSEQISISIDKKKAEQDLKTALYKATESDRLKSTFLATMSHELRTPLNAIIGFSSLVNEETTFEKVLQYNKTISSSGNHLLNIVEDIFDITLIEAGESKLKKARVILNDIMKDIHEIVKAEQQILNKNNLDMKLILDSAEQEILINTDPAKLKQILINLLKNALKFTHEGYIHFGYKINEEKSKKYIEFFVKDTGIGIPNEKQKFIFDVFARLEDSHTATYGGTGIGLSIAKKLTEMLGGTIWLVSDPKSDSLFRGSTFYFTVPYDKGEPEDEIKVEKDEKPEKNTDIKERIILIVEDDQFSFEFLNVVLEKPGTNIFRAIDGKEAIKFCKENPDTDLVLMDLNMPIMNGFKATQEIKKFRPQLPIIAQTAYAISGDREKALAAGCDDYISKPIKKEELLKKIEKLLRG